jgi:pimeloyl-ACP methyl ester carboxylesterase
MDERITRKGAWSGWQWRERPLVQTFRQQKPYFVSFATVTYTVGFNRRKYRDLGGQYLFLFPIILQGFYQVKNKEEPETVFPAPPVLCGSRIPLHHPDRRVLQPCSRTYSPGRKSAKKGSICVRDEMEILVDNKDSWLFTEVYPNSGKETVILLHGGPGAPDGLGPVAEFLAAEFQVISFHQRGYGQLSLFLARLLYCPLPFRRG